ncbi:MAG TPA: pseudouridine-5'-phosphate glycosidase [Kiritimatiellia bacterium]|nr:pseudouridine-5'-phosphate glycosidase [Kiritimatiellia bacterium]
MKPIIVEMEVAGALAAARPVVALESTLITHGLPRPENAAAGRMMEHEVRASGAVPATIALLDGQCRVGLPSDALDRLAAMSDARKCSVRDLPIAIARGECGGTTVAATMFLAHAAGIPVFATGGIGGVHRGHPHDVSADLTALGEIPITVVCAGAKSILDLPLTLEVLETRGVTLVGYRTDTFPAFYTRSSGLPVDVTADSPREVAAIIRARDEAGLKTSVLVVAPVPASEALAEEEAESAIAAALAEANARGIAGKAVTPFLLARVSELTGARSKTANLALLRNNARLAAEIAVALVG